MGLQIVLIGCGSGEPSMLSQQARDILCSADPVIGSGRLLAGLDGIIRGRKKQMVRTDEIADAIREIYADGDGSPRTGEDSSSCTDGGGGACGADTGSFAADRTVAVLLSGDTGFFSGALPLGRKLEEEGIPYTVLPGISSMAMLAARLRTSYSDWTIVSLHGTVRDDEQIRQKVTEGIMSGRKTFFLTGGDVFPENVLSVFAETGLGDLEAAVGQRLFTDDEAVTWGSAEELAKQHFSQMAVLLVEAAPIFPVRSGGLKDELFIRGGVPMTKQYVRAAILSAMDLSDGSTVWDIGAGTGSVSVQLALTDRHGRVFAIEKDPEGVRLIRENRRKFCCWNLEVRQGSAPGALTGLPKPDHVFIGGSGGYLEQILDAVDAVSPKAPVTLTAVTVETMARAADLFQKSGRQYEVVQIFCARSKTMGRYHLMKAENPVFIMTGSRPGRERTEKGDERAEEQSGPAGRSAEDMAGRKIKRKTDNPAGGKAETS